MATRSRRRDGLDEAARALKKRKQARQRRAAAKLNKSTTVWPAVWCEKAQCDHSAGSSFCRIAICPIGTCTHPWCMKAHGLLRIPPTPTHVYAHDEEDDVHRWRLPFIASWMARERARVVGL